MVIAWSKLDCSQSSYFSMRFSRLVRFNGVAAILVCKNERDLGRLSKLPRKMVAAPSKPASVENPTKK